MPIGLSKKETAPVWLKSDEGIPEAERPTFLFHFLTREDVREVRAILARAEAAETDAAAEPLIDQALRLGLAGWRHMRGRDGAEIPYDPANLDKVLTAREKLELAVRYPYAVASAEGLRGNSESHFSPVTAASAPDAAAASA